MKQKSNGWWWDIRSANKSKMLCRFLNNEMLTPNGSMKGNYQTLTRAQAKSNTCKQLWRLRNSDMTATRGNNKNNNNNYYIDGRIYLNLSKSIQSTAGLKALKPVANGRSLMCKSLPYYLHLLYRSTLNPSVSKVHAGSFCVSVIHQTLTWIFNVRMWSLLCMHIHTWVHRQWVRTTFFT